MAEKHLSYKELVRLLKNSDPTTVYEELMTKEENVLRTIDRVINYSNEQELKHKEFTNQSIVDIIHNLFWNMQLMWSELYDVKTYQDFTKVMFKDDRKIYIGILMLVICVMLFFIMISA